MSLRRTRIVLQARTSSTRLQAKVLLPLGGMPLAILCAKRLASSGCDVVLATSETPSDDLLSATARASGIRVYRGDLNDVLSRFVACTSDLADNDIVVRATADNPVPDGFFIDEMISMFERRDGGYLGTSSPADGLPYGLSAEVFTAGVLRSVMSSGPDAESREHVTTTLRMASGNAGILPRGLLLADDCSHLRMTIDTLEDYLRVVELFRSVACPETASWRRLIEIALSRASAVRVLASEGRTNAALTLGTAQFGLDYGVANCTGRPDDNELRRILCVAIDAGVAQLDTARAYGDAERRIGRLLPKGVEPPLRIASKLRPLSDLPDDASSREIANAVDASVYGTCRDLELLQVDVMMFHRSEDTQRWGGAAVDRLQMHVDNGVVREIGVSVYDPEEAAAALADPRFMHLQIPFNVLDDRWLVPHVQEQLAARTDVKVHTRSVFLQGLLLAHPSVWPRWVSDAETLIDRLDSLTRSLNRKSRADLCMAYVRAFPWVASLVLGVETSAQMRELTSLANEPPLTLHAAMAVRQELARVPRRLLNPAAW